MVTWSFAVQGTWINCSLGVCRVQSVVDLRGPFGFLEDLLLLVLILVSISPSCWDPLESLFVDVVFGGFFPVETNGRSVKMHLRHWNIPRQDL